MTSDKGNGSETDSNRHIGQTPYLCDIVDTGNPAHVLDEARTIIKEAYAGLDFNKIEIAFNDVLSLYRGRYPGYRACNTGFHDMRHTMDVFLALARLIHGARLEGLDLGSGNVTVGLVSALLHDVGYIQTEDDLSGSGGKYTKTHVGRSIVFMEKYFGEHGYTGQDKTLAAQLISCTIKNVDFSQIPFMLVETAVLGRMVFASDLMGQMADRIYLEKLPLLYQEFVEGEVTDFRDEADMVGRSVDFVKAMQGRISSELEDMNLFFRGHFRSRLGIDRDLYSESVNANLSHLLIILSGDEGDYSHRLQRSISNLYC